MDKSPEAFRTISEVADALETPAHVLRFWESRFPQIRPVKRAGGRRYYRPADVALLTGIKRLLHDEGMTIRGVQKILREQGIRHVAGLLDETSPEEEALGAAMAGRLDHEPDSPPEAVEDETAAALEAALDRPGERVLPFASRPPEAPAESPVEIPAEQPPEAPAVEPPPAEPFPEVPPEAPPEFPSEIPETNRAALDWLASLPSQAAPTERRPVPGAAAPAAEAPELPGPDAAAAPPPDRPALSVRSVTGGRVASDSPLAADGATATLAARLRALPIGGMADRQEALHEIAARLTQLRERLSGPPPGV
ncbi:MAG: MerR family transcriptional regulator [Rhodobacter sp.]|nr:MerR family transcriptional regulator [Rhodobacter sp.]MBK8438162.1 MerR family transcriptional regulator [Rhodobacter sp.]